MNPKRLAFLFEIVAAAVAVAKEVFRGNPKDMSTASALQLVLLVLTSPCLKLVVGISLRGLEGVHGAQELEAGANVGDGGVLVFLELLVRVLENLELVLEGLFSSILGGNFLVDRGLAVLGRHGSNTVNLLELVGAAKITVLGTARGAKRFIGEFLERLEVAAALVFVSIGSRRAGEVFDGGVSLDSILGAQVLLHSAVHIANDNRLGTLKGIA